MTQNDPREGDQAHVVPRWAAVARGTFRALVAIWAVLYLVSGLVSKLFDFDVPALSIPGVVAFAAVAGVLWLIGEGIAGFRDDD